MTKPRATQRLVNKLNAVEQSLIEEFRRTPALAQIEGLQDRTVEAILIQKNILVIRYFLHFCDVAAQTLYEAPQSAQKAVEWIAQEEFRPYSHRVAAIEDLTACGIPYEKIVTAKPSRATTKAVNEMLSAIAYNPKITSEQNWVNALACIRAAETSAGVEFRVLADEAERRYGVQRGDQKYLEPHADHDMPTQELGKADKSHAGRLGMEIARMLAPDNIEQAKIGLEKVFRARETFYRQFKR